MEAVVLKRKCLVAGLLGVVAAVLFGGTASATITGQTYTARVSPKKQEKNSFGGVSPTNVIDTQYQDLAAPPNPAQITLTFSKDIRFSPGHTPGCIFGSLNGKPTASAIATCPNSVIGEGSAQVALPPPQQCIGCLCCSREPVAMASADVVTYDAVVTAFNGSSSPNIDLHVDLHSYFGPGGSLVFDLGGSLDTQANTLTLGWFRFGGIGIPHLDLTINRLKSGKKTYYISARCKKGKWSNSATAHFPDGSTITSYSTQKCRRKR